MSLAMTQILAFQNINCKLTGAASYQAGQLMNHFPEYKEGPVPANEISIAASGCSGVYIGTPPSTTTTLTLKGSGGGNLAGMPDVIYINMKGNLEIKAHDGANSQVLTNQGSLKFTTLLQLTLTGQSATLSLVYPYGEVFHTGAFAHKFVYGSDTIKLTHTPISVTCANCTRYVCLGDITLDFILQ